MRMRTRNMELAIAMIGQRKNGQQLAKDAGVHPVTISALLNRRRDPKPETAAAIAKALDTTPEKLFGGEGGAHDW